MAISEELNHFRIPMLGKFLGGAMQHTKGSFIDGEVYVITAFNPADSTVQTTGNTSRNRWIDASAFEVVRNPSWEFSEGHKLVREGGILNNLIDWDTAEKDLSKFENPAHDDHVEALSFDSRVWMGLDLANSPDYSVTGRYIGQAWPEMTSRMLRPARPLAADENQHKIISHDFTSLEQAAKTYARKGKSRANHIFATGRDEFIGREHQERRFAFLEVMKQTPNQEACCTFFKKYHHMYILFFFSFFKVVFITVCCTPRKSFPFSISTIDRSKMLLCRKF